jgi:hypothetical protein
VPGWSSDEAKAAASSAPELGIRDQERSLSELPVARVLHPIKNGPHLKRHRDQALLDRARRQTNTKRAKLDRKRRQHLVEPSFVDAANRHGFKRARWRGLVKQSSIFGGSGGLAGSLVAVFFFTSFQSGLQMDGFIRRGESM